MNPKYHLLVAVAALSLGACSTDDTDVYTVPENEGYKISFTVAENPESRTTFTTGDFLRWVSTDEVGVYTVGKNLNSNILTTADVSKSPVEFVGTLKQQVSSGDQFYAYYPYDATQSTDPSAVKLSISAEQKQTKAGVYNGESHPLVAVPMEFSKEWNSDAGQIGNVRFRQLGATVELQLYSSDEALRSESIASVTFESETALAGDFSFDLTSVTIEDELKISGYESKVVTTSLEEPAAIPAESGEAARVYLTIAPGQYTGRIVVTTNAAQYTFSLAKALTFERAAIMGLPADLAEAKRDAINPDASIHFADDEAKQICVENWDTNGDGELSYKEAAAVTSIGSKFSGKSISSFNELQYFTGLQSIEYRAFDGCSSLTSITIPDGVTSIGFSAFGGCRSLTSITIPDGVTEIGNYAFKGCSSLTSIHIPDGVTTIGYIAFSGCSSLTSIHIPDGVTSIGDSAFNNCSNLTSINIPQTVTSIGEQVFTHCSSLSAFEGKYASADHRCLIQDGTLLAFAPADLTEYTIPDGVITIGVSAFNGCSSLTSINIPDGVTTIGRYAFADCSSLTSINIPQTVSSIGEVPFEECSSLSAFEGKYASADHRCLILDGKLLAFAPAGLTQYAIPDGVTAIGKSVFYKCSNLTSINIPEGVTTIEWYAFQLCSSLTSISIPDTVTSIGDSAFEFCNWLTSVYCKPTDPPTLGRYVFSNPWSMQIYVPAASVEAYKTANNWSSYASQIVADDNQSGPGENDLIQFEDQNVKTICVTNWDTNGDGELSYKEAAAVTALETKFKGTSISTFNELQYFTGLQSIGDSTFEGCSNLTSIFIPDGVTAIENWAFYGCSSLTSITIPDGVTAIGNSAFRNCSNLTSITIPDGVTAIGNYVFSYCSSLKSINIPEGVTAIGEAAFYGCSSLTSIHIPNGVTSIGYQAFFNCSSLTSIHIPDGVTTIGERAFQNCSSLTSINIPQTVSSIGKLSFGGCSSLSAFKGKYASADHRCLIQNGRLLAFAPAGQTGYTIPDGVTAIGAAAFIDCNSLTSINLPNGVTVIGDSAFSNCSNLTSINIPDGVTTIEDGAFSWCSNLTSINIPDGVTAIGHYAFAGCSNLTSFYCQSTTPPTSNGNPFVKTPSSMQIYVPAASVEAYKTADVWSWYASQIVADNN